MDKEKMGTLRRRKPNAPADSREDAKNPVVGAYILGDHLGDGTAGIVFRGINTENGEFVALRRIDSKTISSEALDQLMVEVKRVKELNHPNIVRVLDVFNDWQYIYVIMEYVESGSLAQIIDNFGPFPETLTALYTSQSLRGLEYLHANGVVHGSLKGANILITKSGQVKIADFGISKPATVDIPFWSSPEVVNGEKPTALDDIWSLGCTAIELFTGQPPYYNLGAVAATLRIIQDSIPPIPDGISSDFAGFLRVCFSRVQPRPPATELLENPWVKKALPHREEEVTTTAIAELRKLNQQAARRKSSAVSLLATEEDEDAERADDDRVMLRMFMEIDGLETTKSMYVNAKATAKVLVSVALHKYKVKDDPKNYALSEVHQSLEERLYDDDDLPVEGREQWELMETELRWVVKRKAPPVKEGYLRRKSRLRFGSWTTYYVILDKEQRFFAYYNKKPADRNVDLSTDVIYSLRHIDAVTISSRRPEQFVILCNGQLHLLQSDSEEETLDWVNQLRNASGNDFELGYREDFVL